MSAIKQYPTNECTVELHDSALKLPRIEFVKITFLGGLQFHGKISMYFDVSNMEITNTHIHFPIDTFIFCIITIHTFVLFSPSNEISTFEGNKND